MKMEKVGLVPASPGANLGGAHSLYSKNVENLNLKAALKAAEGPGVRILKDRQFGHLLGNPQVIVERRNGSAFVSVRPRPWGWSNVDREFLNPDSPGVGRYVLALVGRIHDEGEKKHQHRERMKALRQAEREAAR